MKATLQLAHRATYSEYLAVERSSAHRHEFIDGVIVAMAGGSDEHNAIAGKVAMLLGQRAPAGCRYFTPDQRFWIESTGRSRYSDGSLICGKPEHPPFDNQATTNPVLILEVLSPSSEEGDEGDKRRDFQSLPSLRTYILASQDRRSVKLYRRDERGSWPSEPEVYLQGQSFEVPVLTAPLAVDDIYAGILDVQGKSLLH